MAGRRNLKMLTWNANSIMLSEDGLREAIWRDKYDIVGITETRLSWDDDLIIPDYKVYRSDRDRHGGGVAIIIKQNIEHRRKNLPGLYGIEAVALVVPTRLGEILFVSAYLPPNEPLDEANFHSLINHQYPVVIMGDLNARHTSWRCESSNVNGNKLHFLSESTDAVILYPNNFTHYPDNDYNPSVIDLFIAVGLEKRRFSRPKARRNLRRMLDSDHVPVEVTLNLNIRF